MRSPKENHPRYALAALIALAVVLPLDSLALSQLDSPVVEVSLGTGPNYEEIVLGQQAQNNTFILTPDSCFFYPKGPSLTGGTASTIAGADLNRDQTFATIDDIDTPGQRILWPVMPANTGAVSIDVFLETPTAGIEVIVRFGDLEQTVTTAVSDGTTAQSWTLNANITNAGVSASAIQFLEIELVNLNGASELGEIHKIEVNGAGLANAYLVRTRWRPWAVHGRLRSSALNTSGLTHSLYVVELRPDFSAEDTFPFYGPVTTKFGYYGVTYDPVNGGTDHTFAVSDEANFSMWSYGANDPQPPVPERSHLLGVGNSAQVFDGYGHEGSGVKPRDGNPLDGRTQETLVLALRMEPHVATDHYRYRTYVSYYWDWPASEWKFYASGRDYLDDSELASEGPSFAAPNSFVEVPGNVTAQRTAQVKRILDYRGWIKDANNNWQPIDTLEGSPNTSNIRTKEWTTSPDGWLRMEMGGLVHHKWLSNSVARTIVPTATLPPYMDAAKLAALETEPVSVTLQRCVVRADGTLDLDFLTSGHTDPATIKLYYGDEDGMTLIYEKGAFPDEWDAVTSLGNFAAGSHSVSLPGLGLPADGFCRLLLEAGDEGRYWTRETGQWDQALFPGTASNAPAGTAVGTISVTNPAGDPVTYSIIPGDDAALFNINPATGALTVASNLPDPTKPFYTLEVDAALEGFSGWRNRVNVAVGPQAAFAGGGATGLPITESFDGTAGQPVSGSTGGTGWNGAWSGDTSWTFAAPNTAFPGIAGAGLKSLVGDQGTNITRPFTSAVTVGDGAMETPELWITATVELNTPLSTGHSVRLELMNGGTQIGYLGKRSNGSLGFEIDGSAFQTISDSPGNGAASAGLWHFALNLKANGSGGVDATLHVAEDSESFTATDPTSYPHQSSTTTTGSITLDAVRLRRHNNTTSAIDEICISPTFAAALVDNDLDSIPDIGDPDDDNDGMPDADEIAYGFDPYSANDAALDHDQDGETNHDEVVYGSHPINATSQPGSSQAILNAQSHFEWTLEGRAGRVYYLLFSTDLQAPWTEADNSGLLLYNGSISLTDTTPAPGRCFYQVKAVIP